MFCKTCKYPLHALPPGPCPECGQPFNPLDPTTFLPTPSVKRWLALEFAALLLSLAPLLSIASIHLTRIAARVHLGRWPVPMADDPKFIPGLEPWHTIAALTLFGIPASALGLPVLLIVAIYHDWRSALRILVVAAVAWTTFLLLSLFDPGRALFWFFD